MYYAAIVPQAHLDKRCIKYRPVQFCLAQHFANPSLVGYREFYRTAVAEGKIVILDNGCYEGELMTFSALYNVITDLKPTVVVLPDVMNNPKLTHYLSSAFLDYFYEKRKMYNEVMIPEFMTVLHGSMEPYDDILWDLIEQYNKVTTSWVGLPRTLAGLRVDLCRRLRQVGLWDFTRKIHALGHADDEERLYELGVYSLDSTHVVWRNAMKAGGDFDVTNTSYVNNSRLEQALRDMDNLCKPTPLIPSIPSVPSTTSPDVEDIPF